MASDAPSSPIQIEKPTYANITLGLDDVANNGGENEASQDSMDDEVLGMMPLR